MRLLLCCALLGVVGLSGCGRRAPSVSDGAVRLQPGQRYRFVDHVTCVDKPGLSRSTDGSLRLPRWGASQPVLSVATPTIIARRFISPGPLVLETGFGIVSLKEGDADVGARFVIRYSCGGADQVMLRQEVAGPQGEEAAGWTPVQIQLPAKAGDEVEVELAVESLGKPGGLGTVAWVNPTVTALPPTDKPNLVILVVDALRPDHLGCYGYERNTSPWLDCFASEGVVFEDVTAQGTWTLPSMSSMLTSSYPLLIGLTQQVFLHEGENAIPMERAALSLSMQGELQKLGYATFASTGGGFTNAEFGFEAGFDWFWTPPTDRFTFLNEHLEVLKHRLATSPPQPFFLLLHTHEIHNYLQGWGHDLARFDRGYSGRLRNKDVLFKTVTHLSTRGLSAADLQYLRDVYDGEIHHTDDILRQFFAWLLAQPWGRNTVVVVTADHGELFGEHGYLHHGVLPYHQLARVPLIIRFPEGGKEGRRIQTPVALTDLMPTVLQLAGGTVPAESMGRSLLPAIAEEKPTRPKATITECRTPAVLHAREGRWSYLTWFSEDREELYDVVADPEQQRNLAGSQQVELARMREVLAREAIGAGRGYRIVAAGRRPATIAVTLSCDKGFSYLFHPTGHRKPAVSEEGKRATITIPSGDSTQVILCKGADPSVPVCFEASMGGKAVPAARAHLGREGGSPAGVPVTLGGEKGESDLPSAVPPAALGGKEWGLWVWSLPSPGSRKPSPKMAQMSEETRRQLKSLGYLQ